MGSNRPLPSPESYPASFLEAIRNGSGILYAADLPWAPLSAAKRFRLCLKVCRAYTGHRLQAQASMRWRVEVTPQALVVAIHNTHKGQVASLTPALIESALNSRENP
jgi:hypothetical protein